MLDIRKVESKNECLISGILNELTIEEKTSKDGVQYVTGVARIRVDLNVNGQPVQNIIPIHMYAKRKKNDGGDNSLYDRIVGYKNTFTSAAAVDDISQASRIYCAGKTCQIKENAWVDRTKHAIVEKTFQISSNFLNAGKIDSEDAARFEITGVVLSKISEVDSDGQETGRLLIDFGIIGFGGRINVIQLIATDNARLHVENNWEKGDTVTAVGIINVSQETKKWKEELGFGEPVERQKTTSKKELLLTGGSSCGNEESASYDSGDVKVVLSERKARFEELLEAAKNTASTTATTKKNDDFGF